MHLSFILYNVQSIHHKLDILQSEFNEFDILWLSQSTLTTDLMFDSFSIPERKDHTGDNYGSIMLSKKNNMHYKCRNDLEPLVLWVLIVFG